MVKKKTKISVIVPYYNMGEFIDSFMISLEKQTLKEFEIVIVNDGSTDEFSIAKLENLRNKRPDIKIIQQKNMGLPGARNTGIKSATGGYICCIDADDEYHPSFLKKACDYLDKHPEIHVVNTWMRTFGET
ncbi:glycosyltransferase family 2 protein [Candidatus Dojkabacteria bacterium]|nr:glycosyltransferase family 2 protein [Candidatus Dojkabacteria bacterium]